MRKSRITKALAILLITSSCQMLPAASQALEQEEVLEDITPQEHKALLLLLKLSAPAMAPFIQPIGNNFIFGGLEFAALAPILKPVLGKLGGSLGPIAKTLGIAAIVAAGWATLVKTLGGANEVRREAIINAWAEGEKAFLEKHRPLFKGIEVAIKELNKDAAATKKKAPRDDKVEKVKKAVTNATDAQTKRLDKKLGQHGTSAWDYWDKTGKAMSDNASNDEGANITPDAWDACNREGNKLAIIFGENPRKTRNR